MPPTLRRSTFSSGSLRRTRRRERVKCLDIDFTPAAALSLSSAGQSGFSASDQSFRGTNDPLNIQQPPPDVIDYWFDLLGLSFDSPPSGDSSNLTSFLTKSQLVDDVNDVSLLLFIMCFATPFGPAYDLGETLIYFEYI